MQITFIQLLKNSRLPQYNDSNQSYLYILFFFTWNVFFCQWVNCSRWGLAMVFWCREGKVSHAYKTSLIWRLKNPIITLNEDAYRLTWWQIRNVLQDNNSSDPVQTFYEIHPTDITMRTCTISVRMKINRDRKGKKEILGVWHVRVWHLVHSFVWIRNTEQNIDQSRSARSLIEGMKCSCFKNSRLTKRTHSSPPPPPTTHITTPVKIIYMNQ